MAKIDWRKARKFKRSEDFRGGGVILSNGEMTMSGPKDRLAARADMAMERWLDEAGRVKSKNTDRIIRSFKQK